jgi:hypothetical protein
MTADALDRVEITQRERRQEQANADLCAISTPWFI